MLINVDNASSFWKILYLNMNFILNLLSPTDAFVLRKLQKTPFITVFSKDYCCRGVGKDSIMNIIYLIYKILVSITIMYQSLHKKNNLLALGIGEDTDQPATTLFSIFPVCNVVLQISRKSLQN